MRQARAIFREKDGGYIEYDWDPNILRALDKPDIPDLWPLFRGLRDVPLLAFRGAESHLLTLETLERMTRELPHMRAVTVPGAGHPPSLGRSPCIEALEGFMAPFLTRNS